MTDNTGVTTAGDILQRTRTFFRERGSETAQLDAQLLLAHVIGVERLQLFMQTGRPMSDEELDRLRDLVRRRAKHEPIAYILGTRAFWTIDLKTDARALIPRPETERIMEACVAWGKERKTDALKIVDVGTGTGALALSLATEFEQAQVVGLDISEDAMSLATENRDALGLGQRVHVVRGDLLGALVRKGSRPDLIVSNPPYIGEVERDSLMADVREHEPGLALFSGDDGLDLIRVLIPQAAGILAAGGMFAMEFGHRQGRAVVKLAREIFPHVALVLDYAGLDRVVLASHDVDVQAIADAITTGKASQMADAQAADESATAPVETASSANVAGPAFQQALQQGLPIIDVDEL
jgi:release factor glutamine methyltransferase